MTQFIARGIQDAGDSLSSAIIFAAQHRAQNAKYDKLMELQRQTTALNAMVDLTSQRIQIDAMGYAAANHRRAMAGPTLNSAADRLVESARDLERRQAQSAMMPYVWLEAYTEQLAAAKHPDIIGQNVQALTSIYGDAEKAAKSVKQMDEMGFATADRLEEAMVLGLDLTSENPVGENFDEAVFRHAFSGGVIDEAKLTEYMKNAGDLDVRAMRDGDLMDLGLDSQTLYPLYRAAERSELRTALWGGNTDELTKAGYSGDTIKSMGAENVKLRDLMLRNVDKNLEELTPTVQKKLNELGVATDISRISNPGQLMKLQDTVIKPAAGLGVFGDVQRRMGGSPIDIAGRAMIGDVSVLQGGNVSPPGQMDPAVEQWIKAKQLRLGLSVLSPEQLASGKALSADGGEPAPGTIEQAAQFAMGRMLEVGTALHQKVANYKHAASVEPTTNEMIMKSSLNAELKDPKFRDVVDNAGGPSFGHNLLRAKTFQIAFALGDDTTRNLLKDAEPGLYERISIASDAELAEFKPEFDRVMGIPDSVEREKQLGALRTTMQRDAIERRLNVATDVSGDLRGRLMQSIREGGPESIPLDDLAQFYHGTPLINPDSLDVISKQLDPQRGPLTEAVKQKDAAMKMIFEQAKADFKAANSQPPPIIDGTLKINDQTRKALTDSGFGGVLDMLEANVSRTADMLNKQRASQAFGALDAIKPSTPDALSFPGEPVTDVSSLAGQSNMNAPSGGGGQKSQADASGRPARPQRPQPIQGPPAPKSPMMQTASPMQR